ncbi:proprotein convertase subtilisin/kexin type 7-like [Diadema antillarum]|uniref:proprotein convertase subtilisin/kexin type 7-like n=1 Tax=Diadema antillarum TaxID=105358 RepID=UPI003A8AE0F8
MEGGIKMKERGSFFCVLVQLQIRLTVFILWILVAQPSRGLYLDFYSSGGPLDPDDVSSQGSSVEHETLSWAVKIQYQNHRKSVNRTRVDSLAHLVAEDLGLRNHGQVGELVGHYLFATDSYHQALNGSMNWDLVGKIRSQTEAALAQHPLIEWFNQQTIRRRFKRSVEFDDPSYSSQWHLHNSKNHGMDINVTGIWEHNITGSGVTVAVIDDGLEWLNEDIAVNYCAEGSWDLNANDNDPMPEMRIKDGKQTQNRHGTRCAGEIAAVRNNICGVGVAFDARVSGIRLLDGPMTDSLEATAFNKFMYINDIYSCSWGPDDDGKTVDGPHTLAKAALQHGVTYGRRGRGNIFVVASGNGGKNGDNCNYDGYANSMYTVTIGAVDEKGQMPFYAEECASLFAVTFSSGSRPQRNIVTTDWTLGSGTGCTTTHTGTSAAAPLAAGMIALMLEAKPCLSWRDIQHIIVYTASKIDEKKGEWTMNAAGFHHSHKHGFGVLKAWRLVNAAKVWPSVPWLTSFITPTLKVQQRIPPSRDSGLLTVEYEVTNSTARAHELATLEHVLVTVSLAHAMRGKLRIELECPSGTRSVIGARRKKDNSRDGLRNWTFSTVRCWGEEAVGIWRLSITDFSSSGGGVLDEWSLSLYGSNMQPEDVAERKAMVAESYGGEFLDTNLTEPCSFYWATPLEEEPYLSLKTIKFLLMISGFSTILALYYSLEQAFCTDEEKQKFANKLSGGDDQTTGSGGGSQTEEEDRLLGDSISLDDLVTGELREVTASGDQSLPEEATYTCVVPTGCIRVQEGRNEGDVDRKGGGGGGGDGSSGVGGLGSNVQSIVSSQGVATPAQEGLVMTQPSVVSGPSTDSLDITGPPLVPAVLVREVPQTTNSSNEGPVLRTNVHICDDSIYPSQPLVDLKDVPIEQPLSVCDMNSSSLQNPAYSYHAAVFPPASPWPPSEQLSSLDGNIATEPSEPMKLPDSCERDDTAVDLLHLSDSHHIATDSSHFSTTAFDDFTLISPSGDPPEEVIRDKLNSLGAVGANCNTPATKAAESDSTVCSQGENISHSIQGVSTSVSLQRATPPFLAQD